MAKKKYEVTGTRKVYGAKPGDVVELDLTEDQERRKIAAGHIKPATKASDDKKKGGDA